MRQTLSDIGVVEIGSGIAGGWCGKAFADLGAHVVKVEPSGGDSLRKDPGLFANINTNKSSSIEPSDKSISTLLDLLQGIDLVIDSSESLADWGVERQQLLEVHPRLSIVAISGFGSSGPYAGYKSSDLVAQAFAGALVIHHLGPVKFPMSVCESAVGHTAAVGALAAILRARASGVGAIIDCAAVQAVATNPLRLSRHLGWAYRDRVPLEAQIADSSSTVLPLGVFPCADGFVAMMMTPQQLGEMLQVIDSQELTDFFSRPDAFVRPEAKEVLDAALYPWLLQHTRQEITTAAQNAGWPVTPVHMPDEVLSADHLHQRGFWIHGFDPELGPLLMPGAPYRLSEGGWKLRRTAPRLGDGSSPNGRPGGAARLAPPAASPRASSPPLEGMRVLDITTVWSGPLLTLHLADLGAEVIRVESPRVFPPTTKGYSPRPNPQMLLSAVVGAYGPAVANRPDRPYNRHSMNNALARGKRSCTLDVRFPKQRELFFDLVARSDIFVENLKSTTLHQMGIHESELLKANPRMIAVRVPPAGLSGDWAGYTGFGGQFDGLTGFAALCGHRNTELYETPSTQYMDSVTGTAGAFAILAALHYRAATGRGQIIELAQSENVLTQLGDVFINHQLGTEARRYGNRDPRMAPQGLFLCADGRLLALSVSDDDAWRRLAVVIERLDLSKDERFATLAGRQNGHDELDEAIAAWTAGVSSYEAFHALQQAEIASAPHLDEGEFAEDPHVISRKWVRPLVSSDVGSFDHLGHSFSGIPLVWERGAPTLGEDNEYVFKQVLGLDEKGFQALQRERIATEDYLDSAGSPL